MLDVHERRWLRYRFTGAGTDRRARLSPSFVDLPYTRYFHLTLHVALVPDACQQQLLNKLKFAPSDSPVQKHTSA